MRTLNRQFLSAARAALGVALAACGSVSGDVVGTRDPSALAGTHVSLIPATLENVTAFGQGCERTRDWYDRYRGEHDRLRRAQAAHAESARVAGRNGPHVARQHLEAASAYRDSLSRLPQAPASEPDSLIERLPVRSTTLDAHGHYAFHRVSPGQYFVVISGVGWMGAEVGRLPARHDIRIGRLQAGCTAFASPE